MSYLTVIITLPVTLFLVWFSIANTGDVTLSLWPVDGALTVGLSFFAAALVLSGFFLGSLFVALLSQRTRLKYWQEKRKNARLEKDILAARAVPASTPCATPPAAVQAPLLQGASKP